MNKWIILIFVFALVVFFSNVNAITFELNGTVYDVNGTALNNANVSVQLRDQTWTPLGTNSTSTNATGWFNMSLPFDPAYMYQLSINHNTTNYVDYVGQTLPMFPYQQFSLLSRTNFYLKEAGTINITVINASNAVITNSEFAVQVKDQKLGYPTGSCSNVGSYDYICYVPRDRNYSIMIYPGQGSQQHFVPVSFDWNNFTAIQDYNIGSLSRYNATTKTLNKQFNVTESMARVSGYLNATSIGISGWEELTIVPFVSEPGNMIFMTYGILPYNTSAWRDSTDVYNLATGFYNISLPYAPEDVRYILFATAKNGTYYGSYRNITVTTDTQLNFTMYKLLGSNSTISMRLPTSNGTRIVNTSRQIFQLINTTNHTLSEVNAHIEATVDYSSYGAIEFTFMEDLSGSNNGNFSLPMLNVTGFKEMNIFSMNKAPKRVPTKNAAQIIANNNITMSTFNPGDVEGNIAISSITISAYKSNSTCDVPVPPNGCNLTSFTPSSQSNAERNMLPIVMGGGKISIRMSFGGISIHYSDVDMLASGPPDGSFDDTTTNSTTGGFSAAMRFGSNGPTIYDYVLVSMPYTQGSTTQSGLNETAEVNMSIPAFYDEDWRVAWNTSLNGTNATYLAGNNSHYSTYQSDWQTLMGNNTCVNTSGTSAINSSYPCHIDKTNNRVWIRLPHFSGAGPKLDGDDITVITTTTTTVPSESTPGGGTGATPTEKKKSKSWDKITPGSAEIMHVDDPDIGLKMINITVRNPVQTVTITVTKLAGKPASVVHEISGKVYKYMEIKGDNINETHIDKVKVQFQVNKSWINSNKINRATIALNRYKNNNWEKLTTKEVSEDNDYIYYEAETPGFSTFAVTGEEIVTTTVATTSTAATITTTVTGVTTTIPFIPTEIGGIPIWIPIIIILIVIIIVVFLYQKSILLSRKVFK